MESAEGSKKHRTRIRLACEPCRKRRRKCNGALPCGQCDQYGYQCRFSGQERTTQAFSKNSTEFESSDGRYGGGTSDGIFESPNGDLQPQDHSPQAPSQSLTRQNGRSDAYSQSHRRSDREWPFFDPIKGRYCRASSSCVFPKLVDTAIGAKANLRLHSYGWNVNIRPEPQPPATSSIRRFLTLQEITMYSDRFFDVIDPIYHFVGRARYTDRCRRYWASQTSPNEDFEALVSSVIAIGSLFSDSPMVAEAQLVEYAKVILDRGSCYAPGRPSLDQSAAWIARTLYLRLTTRPNVCWFASCGAVHIAEAMALHIDLRSARLAPQDFSAQTQELEESRRNLLHCALFLNTLISMEYGRSRVVLQPLPNREKDSNLMALTRMMWNIDQPLPVSARLDILQLIDDLPVNQPMFLLLKIDVVNHMYRRHFHQADNMTTEEGKVMLSMLKQGFSTVKNVISLRQPWWNVLSTPFQSLLVLLAMDTDESLGLVQEALQILKAVADSFPSSLAAEALRTGHTLANGLKERKLSQAQLLVREDALDVSSQDLMSMPQNWSDPTDVGSAPSVMMDNWLLGGTDWTHFAADGSWVSGLEYFDGVDFP